MKILDIVTVPNIVLKQRCAEVTQFDDQLKELVSDMFETMKAKDGIGLAAPQVGIMQRMFVCNYTSIKLVCINPTIELIGDVIASKEACLSIPGVEVEVPRHTQVKVHAYNVQGKPFSKIFSAMMAIIVQHEFDHLNGVLITDNAKTLKN